MKKMVMLMLFFGMAFLAGLVVGRNSIDTSYWEIGSVDKEFISATAVCYALGENLPFFNQDDYKLIFTVQQKDPKNSERIIIKTVTAKKGRKNNGTLEYYEVSMNDLPHILKKEEVLLLNATEVRERLEKIGPTMTGLEN